MTNVTFSIPAALLLLPAVALMACLSMLTLGWQRRSWRRLAGGSEPLLVRGAASNSRRVMKAALTVLALAILVLGGSGPYLGQRPQADGPGRSDLMVVLDVSQSMLVQDTLPSRFEAGRRSIESLLNSLQADCVGLIVFAGAAALRAPCTLDYDAVRAVLGGTYVDSAPLPGSSLKEGLRTGVAALRQSTAARKNILLITDGEDFGGGVDEAVDELKAASISVLALGIGTAQGGPIPILGEDGRTSLKQDASGNVVTSRLDAPALQQIAGETGGSYLTLTTGDELIRRYGQQRGPTATQEIGGAEVPVATLTVWIALGALLLLAFDLLIPGRRSVGPRKRSLARGPIAMLMLLLVAQGCYSKDIDFIALNRAGLAAYGHGEFEAALDAFRQARDMRPELPELSFNVGAALYESGQQQEALAVWELAAAAQDQMLKRNATFNQGDALFQLERYQEAAEAYKRVLRADPEDMEAKVNLELALQKIGRELPEERQLPPGTPQEIPLGDADPGPQGDQPQPPMRPSDGRSGSDPRESQFPPQPGPQPLPEYRPDPTDARPQQQHEPAPPPPLNPREALQRVIEQVGSDITEEEALRILATLRLREAGLQEQYNTRKGSSRQARPEQDW